jgi:hypothetical protein
VNNKDDIPACPLKTPLPVDRKIFLVYDRPMIEEQVSRGKK